MWFRQAPACVLGGLGGSGGGCFLREGGDSRGAARLPVLSPGLSLDPKPKVVRPKTKTYFLKRSKRSLSVGNYGIIVHSLSTPPHLMRSSPSSFIAQSLADSVGQCRRCLCAPRRKAVLTPPRSPADKVVLNRRQKWFGVTGLASRP